MAFAITVTGGFSAAHQLRLYDGSMEPMHGHNWRVKVVVRSEGLDGIGVVMDFHELERMVDAIVGPWHNRNLNEMAEFVENNPSAENVAFCVGRSLELPNGVELESIEVWETDSCSAVYRP